MKTEQQTRIELIDTALNQAGWDVNDPGQVVQEFDILVGSDDVAHQKPMPDEIFKAEKLAHEKASFMVGDTIYDIRAGKKANVKTVAVLTGIHNLSLLWQEKPTMVVKSVKDLPSILLD